MSTFLFLFILNVFSSEGYSCLGYPKIYEAEIGQYFYAYKEALPLDSNKTALYRDFIRHQNFHTFPNMQIFQPEKNIFHGSYNIRKMDFKILSEEDIDLPYTLYLDALVAPPYFSSAVQAYLKKLRTLSVGPR